MKTRRPIGPDELQEIILLARSGETDAAIAEALRRDRSTIAKVVARELQKQAKSPERRNAAASIAAAMARAQRGLCPPSITAEPFSDAWWSQNQSSFCAGISKVLSADSRIDSGERYRNARRRS